MRSCSLWDSSGWQGAGVGDASPWCCCRDIVRGNGNGDEDSYSDKVSNSS